MPEGPEVKSMMTGLGSLVQNKELVSLEVCKDSFGKKVKGFDNFVPATVVNCNSKGKCGWIELSSGKYLTFGFGMTGRFSLTSTDKHNAVKLIFRSQDDDLIVFFNDIRNFGHVWLLDQADYSTKIKALGPCILSPQIEPLETIVSRLRRRNSKTICEALMDQGILSGIGNYIKAEILYTTAIHPMKRVEQLEDNHLYSIYLAARELAAAAYAAGGASLYTYRDLDGEETEFKHQLKIYGKSHDPAGNIVEKMSTPDDRTTHYVPAVQHLVPQTLQVQQDQPKPPIKVKLIARPKLIETPKAISE